MASRRLSPILLLAIVIFSSCESEPPPAKLVTTWRRVAAWSGEAPLQTESFISETGSFRARWTSHSLDPKEPGMLRVTLHSAVSGRPLVPMLEHRGDGEGDIAASEDPREFFLLIEAERARWTVELEEAVQTLVRPAKR